MSTTDNGTIDYKLLFPGQCTQYVGMLKDSNYSPMTEKLLQKSNEIFGYDIVTECISRGPQHILDETIYCQPAIVVTSLAAYYELDPEIKANTVAMSGLSLGGITALIAADAISLEEGLLFVRNRAKAMQRACTVQLPSSMMNVIGLDEQQIYEIFQDVNSITNIDNKGLLYITNQIHHLGYVMAGTLCNLSLFKSIACKKEGVFFKDIPAVKGGFHSILMEPAVQEMRLVLNAVNITMPTVPVYSDITGKPYSNVKEIKEFLISELVQRIDWYQTITNMIQNTNSGELGFVDVGPTHSLKNLLRKMNYKLAYDNCICSNDK